MSDREVIKCMFATIRTLFNEMEEYKQTLRKIKFEVAEALNTLEADCDEYGTFLQIAKLINEVLNDK